MFSIVKNIDTLTIKAFNLYEKTGKESYLMRFHFGSKFCAAQIASLIEDVTVGLAGSDNLELQFENEQHRIESYDRISYLSTLYAATYNLLINKTRIDLWMESVGKKPTKNSDLPKLLKKIKDETGVDIKDVDDMNKLQSVIDRWIEKYHERFMMGEKKEPLTFMQIVIGIFAALGMRIEYSMPISDFFDLKKQAEKTAKKKTDE